MRFSLSSWMMRRALKGLTALTLGATTLTLAGCISPPWSMATPGIPSTPANRPVPGNGTVPPSGIQQVSANMPANGTMADNGDVKETVPGTPLPPLPKGAPTGVPFSIYTMWNRDIKMVPDPLQHGLRSPCLVGRLIMFGADHKEVCQDGTLVITLIDERPANGGPPAALEQWKVDKVNLRKLISTDSFGLWGYTLPMPTAKYRPEMTFIRMDLEFKPDKGNPIYHSEEIRMHSVESDGGRRALVPAPEFNPGQQFPQSVPPQSPADIKAQQLLEAHGLVGPQAAQTMQAYSQGQPQQVNALRYQGQPQQFNSQQYQGQAQQVNPLQYQGQPQQFNSQQYRSQPQQANPQQYQGQPQQANPQQYQGQPQQVSSQQYQGQPQQASPQQYQGQPQQANPQQFQAQPTNQPPYPNQGQAQPQLQGQPPQMPTGGSYGVPPGTLPVQPMNGVNQQRTMAPQQLQFQGLGQ